MSRSCFSEISTGSLWKFTRTTDVVGYGKVEAGDIVMVVEVDYVPFIRSNGKEVPRWDVSLLHNESLFTIKKAGVHIWNIHLQRVDKENG